MDAYKQLYVIVKALEQIQASKYLLYKSFWRLFSREIRELFAKKNMQIYSCVFFLNFLLFNLNLKATQWGRLSPLI